MLRSGFASLFMYLCFALLSNCPKYLSSLRGQLLIALNQRIFDTLFLTNVLLLWFPPAPTYLLLGSTPSNSDLIIWGAAWALCSQKSLQVILIYSKVEDHSVGEAMGIKTEISGS